MTLAIIIFIGIAWGVAVGGGFVAFLIVLGIIPRLAHLCSWNRSPHFFEKGVIFGTLVGSIISLHNNIVLSSFTLIVIVIGLFAGTFIGMLAGALTEVLNVFPILAKRMRMEGKMNLLLFAIVLGKMLGSLFQWIYFVR